jgi:hypothetical protein
MKLHGVTKHRKDKPMQSFASSLSSPSADVVVLHRRGPFSFGVVVDQ